MLSSIFNCILIEVTVEEYTMNIIEPNHSLMLILLSKLTGDEPVDEIYNRTRFAWKTNIDRARSVDYVISHNSNEEIVGIFKPTKWLHADDKEFKSIDRGSYPDRIGFIGEEAPEDIQEMYRDNTTPTRKKGAANPIRYLESMHEKEAEDEDFDIQTVIGNLKNYFTEEIKEGRKVFVKEQNFKVRPGYGPDKFYLDRVQGSYEYSLQNLIHHILWQEHHYESFLNSRQLKDVKKAVDAEPDGIYGTGIDDNLSDSEYKEDEVAQESLDIIYFQVIQHVGSLLKEFDFFDSTDFLDMGYIETDDDSDKDENEDKNEDSENLVNHTYFAGVSVDDEEIDDLVSSAYKFLSAAYANLDQEIDGEHPQFYLVGNKESGKNFLSSPKNLELIKIFKGVEWQDDPEPNEENIKKTFKDNSKLTFFDDGYYMIWFVFQCPEESSEEEQDPGEHWEYLFQNFAADLPDLALAGYNSKFKEIIWQQWSEGQFDEGAISNTDSSDHYSGNNVESEHQINLECFELLD